jgi:hypothetical protein
VSAARWLPAVAVLALALVPWSGNPFYRLAGSEGDGPDPHFDVPFTGVDELRARGRTHANDKYFVDAHGGSPLAQGNAKAAGQLYLARDLPVQDRARAQYVLRLRRDRLVFEPLP